jgi:hypothetical protein
MQLSGTLVVVACLSGCSDEPEPEPEPDAGTPTAFAHCNARDTTGLCTDFVSSFFAGSFTQGLAKDNCETRFQGQFQANTACDQTATVAGYCQIDNFQGAQGATVHRYYYESRFTLDSAKSACETTDLGQGTWHAR